MHAIKSDTLSREAHDRAVTNYGMARGMGSRALEGPMKLILPVAVLLSKIGRPRVSQDGDLGCGHQRLGYRLWR